MTHCAAAVISGDYGCLAFTMRQCDNTT